MSFLTAWIFLLSISLTIAVQLDGICTNEAPCDGPGMVCPEGKCQCNIRWYKPCRSLCELKREFVYEGEECLVAENCIKYSDCRDGKCVCIQDYAAKNGACFKNLNVPCGNHTECWSKYCSESLCKCPPGYESLDGTNTCQRKLLNVYANLNDANISNAFCIDQSSCLEILAECRGDSGQPTMKFCQCPIGYQIDNNKRCVASKNGLLSPLDTNLTNYGPCGVCEVENAVCTTAADERTCWCRSGYVKSGNTCVQGTKSMMIFPNSADLAINNFTNDCSDEFNQIEDIKNKFCICAKGYEFVNKNRPCKKIDRQWINDVYEYGLCTRINSQDEATGEDSLCPEPLKCEEKIDKHVCSCGKDQFRDLDDPSQCVYYVGKQVNSTNGTCPKSAKQNDITGICECLMGYKVINGNRQCELKLSAEPFQSSCNQNQSIDDECHKAFGDKTIFCTIGECRCDGNESFPNNEKTACYSPVNKLLIETKKICPPYSTLKANLCECNAGYRASSDSRQCVRLVVSLIEYRGPSRNTSGALTPEDCQALGFKGPVEVYDTGNCQCRNESFRNEDGNGCWYRFDFTIQGQQNYLFCPPDTTRTDPTCTCRIGFERKGDNCVAITDRIYSDQESAARNISGITTAICVLFFGQGAIKSTLGDYCICRSYAYPVRSNTYCHFLINVTTPESKDSRSCPANTMVSYSGMDSVCLCKPGYNISANNQACEPVNIPLIGAEKKEITNCVIFSNDHCIVKYGKEAFCQNETCFCDRALSYVNVDKKCESFSNFVFPGEQELTFYSCNTDKDCAGKDKVICDYLNEQSGYKVCKCQDGSYLDPKTETCVENRCINCDENRNFECRNYQCRCKSGYYLNDSTCVEYTKLQLYQQCDPNIFPDMDTTDSLVCNNACNRTQCSLGSRVQDLQCVRYQLAHDKCVHQESICKTIDKNSICDRDRNQCLCGPVYYQFNTTCARAVGSVCNSDDDCGAKMDCIGKRCTCNPKQHAEQINDIDGRPIQRCVDNGIDQLRFHPVLILFFLLTRVFLI